MRLCPKVQKECIRNESRRHIPRVAYRCSLGGYAIMPGHVAGGAIVTGL